MRLASKVDGLFRRLISSERQADKAEDAASPGLCYFLVCFQSTDYVSFLLSSLYREQDLFIVHCDKKAPSSLANLVADLAKRKNNVLQLPSHDYSWAGYSHVEVTLRAMELAAVNSVAWAHFICLSEQHLPLRGPEAIAEALSPRSMAAMRPVTDMVGGERADIESRFSGLYRELPGVGCFVTSLAPRQDEFYASIFHGSNWLILSRADCGTLIEAERAGDFALFKRCVHPEETAIPSVLQRHGALIDNVDSTFVAWPHVTDNGSLVMTDELFQSARLGAYHFIRKRQRKLSPEIERIICENHFVADLITRTFSKKGFGISRTEARARAIDKKMRKAFTGRDVKRLDPLLEATPRLHLDIQTDNPHYRVHVLSENCVDFRVMIVGPLIYSGIFVAPAIENGVIRSTVRAKVLHVFGHEDVMPLDVPEAGFVTLPMTERPDLLIEMARRLASVAATLDLPASQS